MSYLIQKQKLAEQVAVARDIAMKVSKFGIDEVQRQSLLYHLALELEDTEMMSEICSIIRERGKCFITEPEKGSE